MIAYLDGVVVEKNIDQIVLDVRGVGYGVFVANEDLAGLELNKETRLHISEHIREQSHDLFGFVKSDTKKLFEKLLEVNGVGPKMALSMLNIGSPEKLKTAIAKGDVKFISEANGVGKRVAERIIVDLKDKLGLISSEQATEFLKQNIDDEAHQALVGLGFSISEASQALSGVSQDLPVEEKVKQALRRK